MYSTAGFDWSSQMITYALVTDRLTNSSLVEPVLMSTHFPVEDQYIHQFSWAVSVLVPTHFQD